MSAFQPYAGEFTQRGVIYRWRCYATTRVHEVRHQEHGPLPRPAEGTRWIWRSQRDGEAPTAWRVDASVVDFSHMLLQLIGEAPSIPMPAVAALARDRALNH